MNSLFNFKNDEEVLGKYSSFYSMYQFLLPFDFCQYYCSERHHFWKDRSFSNPSAYFAKPYSAETDACSRDHLFVLSGLERDGNGASPHANSHHTPLLNQTLIIFKQFTKKRI